MTFPSLGVTSSRSVTEHHQVLILGQSTVLEEASKTHVKARNPEVQVGRRAPQASRSRPFERIKSCTGKDHGFVMGILFSLGSRLLAWCQAAALRPTASTVAFGHLAAKDHGEFGRLVDRAISRQGSNTSVLCPVICIARRSSRAQSRASLTGGVGSARIIATAPRRSLRCTAPIARSTAA
jgi:hypothetical protein